MKEIKFILGLKVTNSYFVSCCVIVMYFVISTTKISFFSLKFVGLCSKESLKVLDSFVDYSINFSTYLIGNLQTLASTPLRFHLEVFFRI